MANKQCMTILYNSKDLQALRLLSFIDLSVPVLLDFSQVVDVGGGTGFCTLGVVKTVKPENVTLIDQ